MDHFRIARNELDPFDELPHGYRNGKNKIAIDVLTLSRQCVWPGHLDNKIRHAQPPSLSPFWQRRQIRSRTLDCAVCNPLANGCYLLRCEAAVADEIAVAVFGQPGRHITLLDHFRDLLRSLS